MRLGFVATSRRLNQLRHVAEWDPAEHPRLGRPPNAGWWVTTTGVDGNGSVSGSSSQDAMRHDHDLLAQLPLAPEPPGRAKSFPRDFGKWNRRPDIDENIKQSPWLNYSSDSAKAGDLRRHLEGAIPAKVRDDLFRAGVGIVIGDSLKQLGHPQPDAKGGIYQDGKGLIAIPLNVTDGGKTGPNEPLHRNARHEFGHALDHMTNGSTDPKFLANFRNDLRNHSSWRNSELRQYVPRRDYPEADAAREAFAEGFASATGPESEKTFGRGEKFEKNFPFTARYLRDLTQQQSK